VADGIECRREVDVCGVYVSFCALCMVVRRHELLDLALCASSGTETFLSIVKNVVFFCKRGKRGGDEACP
jgi:hypothetical protein